MIHGGIMNRLVLLIAVLITVSGVYSQNLVYYWNFNTNTPGTDQSWAQPIASTVGNAQITYTFTEAYSFTGTTINGVGGETAGGSFAPRGGLDNVNNGAYFTMTASTVGYEGVILTYPTRRTSTGFTTQEIKYTIDGNDWITKQIVDVSGYENNWVASQLVTADFSSDQGVSNNPNFAIRIILTGATSAVGNNRFDNIQIVGVSQGAAATPTFNPPAGVYTQPINVAISTTTADATIRYTLDGTDPTTTSPVYSNPIPVSQNTTIKARAYATGLDPSNVGTASYLFPVVVQNMSQLRAQPAGDGTVYMVSGQVVLTFKQSFRNQKYVQDNGAGVLIDDTSNIITTNYQVGDGITGLTGTLARYNEMLQLTPMADPGVPTSTGNSVFVPVVNIAAINNNVEYYQARLVRINNAHFQNPTGNFATGVNYTLEDASGNVVFRTTFYDVDYIGEPIPTGNFSLVVLVNQFNQTPQVTARNLDDWGAVSNDDDLMVPVTTQLLGNYPNPFNPSTTIEFYTDKAETVQIEIFNQKGQIVRTWDLQTTAKGTHSLTWNGTDNSGKAVSSGIYYYRMRSGKFSSTRKMVLMK